MKTIELIASVFAIVGAFFVANNNQVLGYSLFICSGCLFIPWAYKKGAFYILIMETVFSIVNVYGLLIRVI